MLGLSARTIGRFGPYRVLLAGLVLIAAGMALLSRVPVDGSYAADVLPPMLLLAAGFAAAMPAVTGLAMSGVMEEDAGLASGLFNTTQVVLLPFPLPFLTGIRHSASLVGNFPNSTEERLPPPLEVPCTPPAYAPLAEPSSR